MKRFIALFLCLVLTGSLFACSSSKKAEESVKEPAEDLSGLSGAEFYARALSNMDALPSYELESAVTGGEEDAVWTVCRVRTGLSYRLSRTNGKEGVYYDGETAWILSDEGNYSAPASSLAFENFYEAYLFPVGMLDLTHFSDVSRDGSTVTYTGADDTVKAAFGHLADLPVTEVAGKAVMDENTLLAEEEITVNCEDNGTARTFTVKTKRVSRGETEIAVEAVPADAEITAVGDIRLPVLLRTARDLTLSRENITVTLVTEESGGGYTRSAAGNFDGVGNSYSLVENLLVKTPDGERNTVNYTVAEGASVRRAVYDSSNAALLSDETVSGEADRKSALAALLPAITGASSLEVTETASAYNVDFTLGENSSAALFRSITDRLGASPDTAGITVSGSIAVDRDSGVISSVFYELKGEGIALTGRGSYAITYGDAALATVKAPALPEA